MYGGWDGSDTPGFHMGSYSVHRGMDFQPETADTAVGGSEASAQDGEHPEKGVWAARARPGLSRRRGGHQVCMGLS